MRFLASVWFMPRESICGAGGGAIVRWTWPRSWRSISIGGRLEPHRAGVFAREERGRRKPVDRPHERRWGREHLVTTCSKIQLFHDEVAMRARILRLLLAAITVSASMTRTASAAGVNLAWADCGVYGTMLKTFSCDSNIGLPFMLYGSFVPPPGIDQFVGIAAQVDLCTMTSSFVDWWAHGTGYCRGTNALFTSFDFTAGPFNCADPYLGQAAGGFAYDVSFGDVDRA